MAKKTWNSIEMQDNLINDMQQEIKHGKSNMDATGAAPVQKSATQPTAVKGVQTNIPVDTYRRLMELKLTRKSTIGTMLAEAVEYWLDAQEKDA